MNIILRSVMCFVIIGVSLVSFIGCDSPSDPGNSCFRVEEFQYTHYKRFISTGEPASDGIELSIATGDILFIETETGFKFRAGTEFAWEINATCTSSSSADVQISLNNKCPSPVQTTTYAYSTLDVRENGTITIAPYFIDWRCSPASYFSQEWWELKESDRL